MWGLHLPVAPTPAGQGPGAVTLTVAFSGRSPWTGQASRGEAQRQRAGLGFAVSALQVSQPPAWLGSGSGGCRVEDRGPSRCGMSSLGEDQAERRPLGGHCGCHEAPGQGGDWTLAW